MNPLLHSLAFGLFLQPLLSAEPAAWPGWRGDGSGVWPTQVTEAKLRGISPRLLWKKPLGKGFGGISVTQDRLMVMDRQEKPEEKERLLCLHPDTGELRWEKHWPVTYGSMGGYSTGPRTTVLQSADVGYALGATGRLSCFELETGKVRWELDAVKDLDAVMPQWGYAGSPVLHEDKLLVHLGVKDGKGSVVALDPATGKKLWTGGRDAAGYSAPQPFQTAVLQWGPNLVEAFSAIDGTALWSYPYEITYGVSIAQPLIVGDLALVSGYWHGTKVFKLSGAREVKLLWENEKELCGLMASPLEKAGVVYMLDKQHGFTAFQLADGKILWRDDHLLTPKDRNPQISIVWLDRAKGIIAGLNAIGELVFATVKPEGISEIGRHQIIGKTWAHPAFVGNRIYARSDTEIVAWELWPED